MSPELERVSGLIREVADFPQPGVLFRDLSPLLADAEGFRVVVEEMAAHGADADVVVGIEARGFLLGAALALRLGLGVVGVRKPGKLPAVAHRIDYALEYGTATLELPEAALRPGSRALVVDDVLATGGTVEAACALVEHAEAEVSAVSVVMELAALNGRGRLAGRKVRSLLTV
ncbi:adenine phosphoribosyltransferase [Allokutzneria albata]|uniref:Adenine phosphoribosyltransferase n=1 Tax=Allokutzneria albata TaxID=211114 RepID=A0A1H0DGB8_ALLAB|nr:adenine phosphoribosyltransferase [Allokutzneria albata]SDN69164.1 adenine phosphoribosyltransferase [Allokutzneria albata]